ncbi:hypothetical protein niasHT_031531 [Heterodera trifolii]|uniref:Uncharacterized protein n=1 Tax=Heterodera trifolii TaxID=157864 RepID=A0ABD2HTK2_9BILA
MARREKLPECLMAFGGTGESHHSTKQCQNNWPRNVHRSALFGHGMHRKRELPNLKICINLARGKTGTINDELPNLTLGVRRGTVQAQFDTVPNLTIGFNFARGQTGTGTTRHNEWRIAKLDDLHYLARGKTGTINDELPNLTLGVRRGLAQAQLGTINDELPNLTIGINLARGKTGTMNDELPNLTIGVV